MVNAVQHNDRMLDLWGHLWTNSMFGFLPKGTWHHLLTPQVLGISIWCLSTLQFILPLMKCHPWPGSRKSPGSETVLFPTRRAGNAHVHDSAEIIIQRGERKTRMSLCQSCSSMTSAHVAANCVNRSLKYGVSLPTGVPIAKALQTWRLPLGSATRDQCHFPIQSSGFMGSLNSKKATVSRQSKA